MRLPAPVWIFAGGKVGFHLLTTRLGYHRDELYFVSASKRLAWSYVDFQPITPFLVRAARYLFGDALLGIRLVPALAGGLVVVLAALLARELGGNRRAQIFAAFAALVIPFFVGANSALNTVSLVVPAWLVVVVGLARVARTDEARVWVWVGIAAGVALLVKFTVLAYLVAIPLAVLATPSLRKHLRTPWPWLGAVVALAIVTPSLVWQIRHGLPIVEFVGNQSTGGRVLGLSGRGGFLASLVIFPGPVGLFLVVRGVRWLVRDPSKRAIAVITLAPAAIFFIVSGKGYYAAPALAVAIAAGAVATVARRQAIPRALVAALIVNLAVPMPLLVPLVPVSVLRENEDLAQGTEFGERIGWEELAETTRRVTDALPATDRSRAVVIGSNYGISSAVEFYRERMDLPPAVSGHNSAYLWWPDVARDHVAVVIGFDEETLRGLYGEVERVGTVRNSEGVRNYEWGDPIHVAREARQPWSALRERLRRFTA